jgi:hypothetical protein
MFNFLALIDFAQILLNLNLVNDNVAPQIEMIERSFPLQQYIVISSTIISAIIIIFIQLFYKISIFSLFTDIINVSTITNKSEIGDSSANTKLANLLFIVIFILGFIITTYSYFAFLYSGDNNSFIDPVRSLVLVLKTVLIYFAFKFILLHFLGWTFNQTELISKYLRTMLSYYKVLGIILFFVNPFLPFFSQKFLVFILCIIVVIFLISMFFRMIKGFLFSFQIKFSILYSFLYFCAVEIFPLLVIVESFRRII